MSSDAIVIEGLGKQYTIGTTPIGDATLGESITSWVSGPWRRFKQMAGHGEGTRTFWALKDVSFWRMPKVHFSSGREDWAPRFLPTTLR